MQVSGLVMLIPYGILADQSSNTSVSSFAYAFQRAGLHWAAYIVSACASLGIITNVGISALRLRTLHGRSGCQ